MRLINVDKLFKTLNKLEIPFYADINNAINSQPTAYNVDKVVEQLEEKSYYIDIETDSEEVVNLNEAIEIVRSGGLDD